MSGKAKRGSRGRKNQAKQGEKKEKEKVTQSVVSQADAGEIYATLRDASATAEEQQALFQRCLPVWDYFGVYCPDLHKCRDSRSFYESV